MRNAIGARAVRLLIPAAALLGVGGLAILPGTAMGEPGYTLNMSGPATVTPGQATIFQAAGANPPSDFFSSWLDVSAIPTSVLATCPDDYLNASQIADSASAQGGERVVVGQRETLSTRTGTSRSRSATPLGSRGSICFAPTATTARRTRWPSRRSTSESTLAVRRRRSRRSHRAAAATEPAADIDARSRSTSAGPASSVPDASSSAGEEPGRTTRARSRTAGSSTASKSAAQQPRGWRSRDRSAAAWCDAQ